MNSSPAAAVGVGEAAVAAAGPAAVAVPAEVVALPGEAVERAEAVERDPAAIALPRLARPEATGGRVAAVGRQVVIDRKWLNGREPVAVAAADPVAECRPAAKRGPARAPPIDAPVLVLDLELLDDKTSADQGLAAAHVSQTGLPPGPTSAAVRALAADQVWAADRVAAIDLELARVLQIGLPTDRESVAGRESVAAPGSAAARPLQTGLPLDPGSVAGLKSGADRRSVEVPVLQTGGAGPVYLHLLQGQPAQRWVGALRTASATVPLRRCRD